MIILKDYGCIYVRSNGLVQGSVQYRSIKKTFYGRDKQDVQNRMNDWVLEMKYNNVSSDTSVLLSDFVELYLFTFKKGFIKDSSFDRLESIYRNHVKGSSIDIPLYKLDDVIVQNYLNDKCSCSKSTIKKITDLVRSVLTYAYKKNRIEYDIASMLTLPKSKIEEKHIEVYTDSEVNTLETEIKRIIVSSSDKREAALFRYAPAFIILLNTGLRAGELLALTWKHVDLNKNLIYVRQSLSHIRNRDSSGKAYVDVIGSLKTEKSKRDVPINSLARECFLYLKSISDCDYVVNNGHGSFLLLRSFQQTFERVCIHVGVPYKGLHALRHTFASRLIAAGVSVKCVSDLLGHTSVVFTLNRYVHSNQDNLRDAVEFLQK